jgi:integrase
MASPAPLDVTDSPDRFAPQLHLDASRPLDRLIIDRLGGRLAAIESHRLVPPVSESTRRLYTDAVLNFRRFCVHEGLVENLDAVAALPIGALRAAVVEWLVWRSTEVSPQHPLTRASAKARGELASNPGGWRAPAARRDVEQLRSALVWWALSDGLGDIVGPRARAVRGTGGEVRGARALSDEDLVRIVDALLAEKVVEGPNPEVTAAWHARQLAAIAVSLAGALRPTAELPMLRDENIVAACEDHIDIRLPRTKHHPEGRTVRLHRRNDALCPIGSLARFLEICNRNDWHRDGALLPGVDVRRHVPLYQPTRAVVICRALRRITEALGITVDEAGLATPHGLRATVATRAFEAGFDHHAVMRLTGHATIAGVTAYDRRSGSHPLARDMADGLAGTPPDDRNHGTEEVA